MTKVHASPDCGNSPKNIFIQDLTIAIAKGNTALLIKNVTDDFRWNIVGDWTVEGKDEATAALKRSKKVAEITIQHVTSHGRAGAVNGTIKLTNGKQLAFCDVYEFGNTKGDKVREITSYIIETK
jgi:hypothetical protein